MSRTDTATFAICEDCQQEMVIGGGCTFTHVAKADRKPVKRIVSAEARCHDCNAGPGQPHHPGCDWERCPGCGVQMLNCWGDDPESAEFFTNLGTPPCQWIYLLTEEGK